MSNYILRRVLVAFVILFVLSVAVFSLLRIAPGNAEIERYAAQLGLHAAVPMPQGITPLGHMAVPQQIADVMFFLLGPQSSYVTGADIAVDGGVLGGGIFWPVGRAVGALGEPVSA